MPRAGRALPGKPQPGRAGLRRVVLARSLRETRLSQSHENQPANLCRAIFPRTGRDPSLREGKVCVALRSSDGQEQFAESALAPHQHRELKTEAGCYCTTPGRENDKHIYVVP